MIRTRNTWRLWFAGVVIVAGAAVGVVFYVTRTFPGPQPALAREYPHEDEEPPATPTVVAVDVVRPQKGMDYEVEQPGSVHAYETVQLHAKVSGFLKEQKVDIGDRVKKGEVLAVVAVPELDKQLQRNQASLEQAEARVKQMEARVVSARADLEAAKAAEIQADAAHESAVKWVKYRKSVYDRIYALWKTDSIEEKVVDEKKELYEAARETERSTKAGIATSKANVAAAAAKIDVALADVLGAKSEVKVAQADIEKTQVLIDYATITAPFDGEITHRSFFPKDFIRSASDGTGQQPLLTIQRTDKLRVVVQVPDSAVPYLDKGDPATVRIDSLSGKKFDGKVSRKAGSEDPNTRLMQVEVDLDNPSGEIGDGMYGKVRILLDRFPNLLSVPSTSLLRTKDGRALVCVVRNEHVHFNEVRVCKDNGRRVCLHSGLRPEDLIVLHPSTSLIEGAEVQTHLIDESHYPPVYD